MSGLGIDQDTFLEIIADQFESETCAATHADASEHGFPCLITPVARMWWCEEGKHRPVCLNMVRFRDLLVNAPAAMGADRMLCNICWRPIEECWEVIPL